MPARLIDRLDPRPPKPTNPNRSWPTTIGSVHIPGKASRRPVALPTPPSPPKKL